MTTYPGSLPRVCGESGVVEDYYTVSHIQTFALRNRRRRTHSEIRFENWLRNLNGGVLRERYRVQHPISGKWIVDFFIPEIRLAIEIDGSIHNTPSQAAKDAQKTEDCMRFDITLLRLTNREVWGEESRLLAKLREYWRKARSRENLIIGKPYPMERP